MPISKIPQQVRNAFIATEDRNFYQHHGLDFGGHRARRDLRLPGRPLPRRSTITQQLARALFLSNEVSMSRKIQEALLALEIERNYTKDKYPRALSQHHLFRRGRVRDRGGGAYVFRHSVDKSPRASGAAGRPPRCAVRLLPVRKLGTGPRSAAHVLDRMVASGFVTPARPPRRRKEPLGLVERARRGAAVVQISLLHHVRYPRARADLRLAHGL